MTEIKLYFDAGNEMAQFAVRYLKERTAPAGLRVLCGGITSAPVIPREGEIVAKKAPLLEERHFDKRHLEDYELSQSPNGGWILQALGGDSSLMYALMDLGDALRRDGLAGLRPLRFHPSIERRGVKFNLPFEPYDEGDPTEKNYSTCLSMDFWRQYIDMLAKNRYNFLSLWSEHPFHMMFRLNKYPDTCPYDDQQLAQFQQLYHFIFQHAHARGMKVALITWNIRLPECAAKGLGLPRELGNPYPRPADRVALTSSSLASQHFAAMDGARQAQPVIQDYFRECIKTLLLTYSDIDMIGTNCAEEMVGDMQERQKWVEDAYLMGLKDSGRRIPFIMRTNCGSCALAESFLEKCPADENFISWKYSYAHMYSAQQPPFEQIEKVWEKIKCPEKLNVLFTVRNDDFHTLRWGDPDFIREYLKAIADKPYCRGFYWGADGFLYGNDFAHDPEGHKVWKYEFEKHWLEFSLLGRLSYNLDSPYEYWQNESICHYGHQGGRLYEALQLASKIMPPVNRLHWMDIDVRWHPETLLSMFGFRSVIDTYFTRAMPGTETVSIREFAHIEASGAAPHGETPVQIIDTLSDISQKLDVLIKLIETDDLIGESACLLEDLYCWQALGEFYTCRFRAALALARLEFTKKERYREEALAATLAERAPWRRLAEHWASHYTGYRKARGKMMTGYWLYMRDIERDVELVEAFGKIAMEPSDYWTRHNIQKA